MSLTTKGSVDAWQLVPVLLVLLQAHIAPLPVLDVHKVKGRATGTDHLQIHSVLRVVVAAQRAIFDGEPVAPQVQGARDDRQFLAAGSPWDLGICDGS